MKFLSGEICACWDLHCFPVCSWWVSLPLPLPLDECLFCMRFARVAVDLHTTYFCIGCVILILELIATLPPFWLCGACFFFSSPRILLILWDHKENNNRTSHPTTRILLFPKWCQILFNPSTVTFWSWCWSLFPVNPEIFWVVQAAVDGRLSVQLLTWSLWGLEVNTIFFRLALYPTQPYSFQKSISKQSISSKMCDCLGFCMLGLNFSDLDQTLLFSVNMSSLRSWWRSFVCNRLLMMFLLVSLLLVGKLSAAIQAACLARYLAIGLHFLYLGSSVHMWTCSNTSL
jgi:hypothetical protein